MLKRRLDNVIILLRIELNKPTKDYDSKMVGRLMATWRELASEAGSEKLKQVAAGVS